MSHRQWIKIRVFLADKQKTSRCQKETVRIYSGPDGTLEGYLLHRGIITSRGYWKSVYCFMEDKQGNIWMGTKKDGLYPSKKK